MLHYLVQVDKTGEGTDWVLASYGEQIDVDVKTGAGVTPLMLAVKRNYTKPVQSLLNGRANPFYTDQLGQEAIDYAVALDHAPAEATYPVKEMIELAKQQWLQQVSKEEALVGQPAPDAHFDQFKDENA